MEVGLNNDPNVPCLSSLDSPDDESYADFLRRKVESSRASALGLGTLSSQQVEARMKLKKDLLREEK